MSRMTVSAFRMLQAREGAHQKEGGPSAAKAPYRPSLYVKLPRTREGQRRRREFWLTRVAVPAILGLVLTYAVLRAAGVFQ